MLAQIQQRDDDLGISISELKEATGAQGIHVQRGS
jgi:hypothetical protein